ncbi:hypothetical protein OOJ91_13655 [Micromonospora lupini]|uniref:hypothetical protein n=1 Tax=Micromonospora lupini TaxID=285679 RepID=UPI00225256FD|nr:hypothetical protein [Micromonospora lupini]MCX5066892.1 hypothetical protein [Micromonospora lupini]
MDVPVAELAGKVGPVGLLSLVVLLILTGRLLPRPVLEDRIRDKAEQITHLQETLASRDEELRVRGQQVDKLLAQSDLTVQLLQSLAREAGRDDLVA